MHILGFILIVSGVLIVTYFSGPNSSSNQSIEPTPQGQVSALPINSPGSDKEEMVTTRNKTTGEVKQIPKSEVANYVATPKPQPKATKASDKALKLAIYILTFSNEKQRIELINKLSNGKNDLALAISNLALFLDSKPEALALAEKTVAQDLANRKSQEELEYHEKEYQRLKELNDSLTTSSNDYSYIGGTQNTNRGNQTQWSGLSEQKPQQPLMPIQNTYKEPKYLRPNPTEEPQINILGGADSYTRYGNTVYGNDGSSYTQYGNTVYGNDGSSYTQYGNTIYGNNGSSFTKYGNTTYGNDGTSYTQYGNTTYGNDGSSYTQYGNTIYTQPGY